MVMKVVCQISTVFNFYRHFWLTCSQRSHKGVLCVHLVYRSYSFGKHVNGNFITVLVTKLSCLLLGPLNLDSSIGYDAPNQLA
jgi:hypothetical protein